MGSIAQNPSGRLLQVNRAMQQMLGYTSVEALLQINLATQIHGDPLEHERLNALFESARGNRDVEATWKHNDGSALKLRCSGLLVKTSESRNPTSNCSWKM